MYCSSRGVRKCDRVLLVIALATAIVPCLVGCLREQDDMIRLTLCETLTENGSTRATAYAMSNKIISVEGSVFLTWLDSKSAVCVKMYDIKTGTWSDLFHVGKCEDNHGDPTLTLDSEGYLHIIYGPHVGPLQYRRSVRPFDASEWSAVESFGVGATYPSVVSGPDDRIFVAYRSSSVDHPWRLLFQWRSQKEGGWSEPVTVVDAGREGYAYFGNSLAIAADGSLHLAFCVVSGDPPRGHLVGHLVSRDTGRTWERIGGERVELPITPDSACFIEQGNNLDMRVGNVCLDSIGNPWFTTIHLETSPRTVILWHHNGQEWTARDLARSLKLTTPHRELVDGCVAIDGEGALYVVCTSVEVLPQDQDFWGHPSKEVVLLYSEDMGESFQVVPLCRRDSGEPNWLPAIERPFSGQPIGVPSLMFTHGGPGEDNTGGPATEVLFVRLERTSLTGR